MKTVYAASWPVKRAAHAPAAAVEHVGVDHRGAHVLVAQKFLDGADVIARSHEMVAKECLEVLCEKRPKFFPRRVVGSPCIQRHVDAHGHLGQLKQLLCDRVAFLPNEPPQNGREMP